MSAVSPVHPVRPVRAVVVGGASGIGAAIAARHRTAGDELVVWDRAEADVVCDIADPAQVERATAETIDAIGPPTVVTITAGIGHSGMLLDAPADDWDRVLGVNAKGVWLAMRALARPMIDAAAGPDGDREPRSIVATTSISGRLVDRSMGLYCASKSALDAVIRTAAMEWAPAVRVNGIAPGVTDTPMLGRAPRDAGWLAGVVGRTAMGRLGTPDDVADAVAAIHALPWLTGQIVECDGGLGLESPIDPLGPRRRP